MANARIVCFYCISTHLGGAERSLLDIICNLEKLSDGSLKPWVIFPQRTGPIFDILSQQGVECTVLKMPSTFFRLSRERKLTLPFTFARSLPKLFSYFLQLNKLIRSRKPLLVYSTGLKCHILASMSCRFTKIQTLLHFRDLLNSPILRAVFNSLTNNKKVSCIANSKATQNTLPFSSKVIYNGFDLKRFHNTSNGQLYQLLGLNHSVPIVGILGALAHWKGQKLFIETAAELIANDCPAHFVIIGDEIYDTSGDRGIKAELVALVDQYEISDRVHFVGFQKEPEYFLKDLTILVHASLRPEPFGRVIVEGMASGSVVVAADAGGVREIVRNNKTGFLCKPGDKTSYVNCIGELLNSPKLRESVAAAGTQSVQKMFGIDAQLKKMVNEFKRCS